MNSTAPAPAPLVIRIRFWAELARLMLVAMELMLVSGWYNGLDAQHQGWARVALVLGGVVMVSHYLARLLNAVRISARTRRVVFAVWIIAAMLGSMKLLIFPHQPVALVDLLILPFIVVGPEQNASLGGFIHLLLVGFLIWRGVVLAAAPVTLTQIQRSFQVGIVVLIFFGLSLGRAVNAGYGLVFAFLVIGFLGMASARMSVLSDLRGGRAGRFAPDWLLAIAGSSLLLVGLGLLAGSLLHWPVEWVVKAFTGLVMGLLGILLVVMAYPLLLLVEVIGPALQNLFANFPQIVLFQEIEAWLEEMTKNPIQISSGLTEAFNASRVGMRILTLAAIFVILLLLLRLRPLRRRAETEEETSNLELRLGWPRRDREPRRGLAGIPGLRRWLAAAHIRRIYAELMALFARMQQPRPQALTPLEFLPHMQAALPEQISELEVITRAYLGVRYGQYPETREEVQAVEQAWARVQIAGRKAAGNSTKKDTGSA